MDLSRVCAVLVGGAVRLAYDACMCSGMSLCRIYTCYAWWTIVEVSVRCVGSLRCGVSAGRSNVFLRVSRHVQSCASRPLCFLFGSLAIIASVC